MQWKCVDMTSSGEKHGVKNYIPFFSEAVCLVCNIFFHFANVSESV